MVSPFFELFSKGTDASYAEPSQCQWHLYIYIYTYTLRMDRNPLEQETIIARAIKAATVEWTRTQE